LVIGLALVGFACAESVGQMLEDAGTMLQDGSVPDAGAQDTPVECNKSEDYQCGEATCTQHWAEFPITPGQTEVTICNPGDPNSTVEYGRLDTCYRTKAAWFDGTSTGFTYCGIESDAAGWIGKPKSITVHR
jgi:hypothetical protein